MRFLLLNTDYPEFLSWLYAQHPGLENRGYEEQMHARNKSLFGTADFYSDNLRKLDCEACDIHANNQFLQKAWAREHRVRLGTDWQWKFGVRKKIIPRIYRTRDQSWYYKVLAAQIRRYKPDILLNHAVGAIDSRFLKEMRAYAKVLVGQIASPLPEGEDFSCYDLVISSLPNFVAYFQKRGMRTEFHSFGFEPMILKKLGNKKNNVDVSFIGSLSPAHKARISLLEHLSSRIDIKIWGHGVENLPEGSPIRRCFKGHAWGAEMYGILRDSKITLNSHIDVAESYANNMRLFEATGVGALLITDRKNNLSDYFKIGREIAVYHDPEECVKLIEHYLAREEERQAAARAGQARTLREHTYYHRMQEFVKLVQPILSK